MKLLIFQASDIHVSTDRYPNNPVLKRVTHMVAAVRSLFLSPDDVASSLLVVTGDVAYAGLKAEYDLALPFFRELRAGLTDMCPKALHHTIFIPGNHDCNFKENDQARQKLIDDPDPALLVDGSIVTAATVVQRSFFEFCREFSGAAKAAEGLDRLYCPHEFDVGGKQILVRSLNSAWASRIPESRTLMLPVQHLEKISV